MTAAISWVLSIYPVLTRRRPLAHEVALLDEAGSATGIGVTRTNLETAAGKLDSLASQLLAVRGDFLRFPITYYFSSDDERASLPAHLRTLARLAERGTYPGHPPAVRLAAEALRGAERDLFETLETHVHGRAEGPATDVAVSYARDHLRRRAEPRAWAAGPAPEREDPKRRTGEGAVHVQIGGYKHDYPGLPPKL